MVTIQHLEVLLEVDGTEEAAFARLFDKHIRRWHRGVEEERARRERLERERRIAPAMGEEA